MNRIFLMLTAILLLYPLVLQAQDEIQEFPENQQGEYIEEPPSQAYPERTYREDLPRAPSQRQDIAQAMPSVPLTAAQGGAEARQISDKITLDIKNMDVVEAIKLLSAKGGYDVVVSQNVRGRITLFLDNVPIWDALQIVFQTTDLAYTKHGDIIRIVTEREHEQQYGKKFNDYRVVKIIPLKYASTQDAGRQLKQLKSRIGNVIEDDRTNSLIIIDTEGSIKTMETALLKIDVPVETKVFSLLYTPAKSLEENIKKLISKKGIMHVDDATNKIIVTDSPEVIRQVNMVICEYDKPQYLQTKIFTLNYAKFDKVEEKIKDMITKDVGMIKSDERTNKIVVTDLPEKISKIEKLIAAYDEKSRQVLIEAKIVQVALSDEFKMGINWQLVLNKVLIEKYFHTDTIDMTLSSVFETLSEIGTADTAPFDNSVRASHPGGRTLITGTLKDGSDFDSIIDILKTAGKTNLLSSPRILAVNNQEAKFEVATREAFVTNTVVQSDTAATTAENVTFVDVGIKLNVTPTIGEDGFITLKIKPEVSNVVDYLQTAQGNKIPIVATQEAETVIMVKDGTTVIMGGLIEDQQKKTERRVPILGSIPLLGIPFRKVEDEVNKSELVIFLTPHLISGEADMNAPSPEMVEYLDKFEKERQKASEDAGYERELETAPPPKPKGSSARQHRFR